MRTLIEIALIIIAAYCLLAWIIAAANAIVAKQRGTLTFTNGQALADFTFRVGLTGTIALGALFIGG